MALTVLRLLKLAPVVWALWYDLRITPLSYDSKGCKKYKLLPEIVHVPVSTLVQEHELEWEHEGRSGGESLPESTLKEVCHAALMQHNYSNVKCEMTATVLFRTFHAIQVLHVCTTLSGRSLAAAWRSRIMS